MANEKQSLQPEIRHKYKQSEHDESMFLSKGVPPRIAPKPGEPAYSWEEVAKHNHEQSAWIIAGCSVYDVTKWIEQHPGGKQMILLAAGRDITDLLTSYHPFSGNKVSAILEKMRIGAVSLLEFPQYKPDGGFYADLQHDVAAYFEQNHIDPKDAFPGLLRLVGMLFVALACYTVLSLNILPIWAGAIVAVLFGVAQALPLLHCMHDASHAAIGSSPTCWHWVGRATMDWFAGASMTSWHHQHIIGHHLLTNVPGGDPDLPAFQKGDIRRVMPQQHWAWPYQYQYIYLSILYGVLAIKFRIQDITDTLWLRTNAHIRVNLPKHEVYYQITSKIFWAFWRIYVPLYVFLMPSGTFWLYFVISEMATGFYLTFNFQVSHVSPVTAFTQVKHDGFDEEWAASQLKSSVDYDHGNAVMTFLCGALNYQTVHHLFPSVSQYHYPALAPIVDRVARKYNLPYHRLSTFWHALGCHMQHLRTLGFQEQLHMHAG